MIVMKMMERVDNRTVDLTKEKPAGSSVQVFYFYPDQSRRSAQMHQSADVQ